MSIALATGVSSFFNTDETKEEYNASEPVTIASAGSISSSPDGHTGNYTARKQSPPSTRPHPADMLCYNLETREYPTAAVSPTM